MYRWPHIALVFGQDTLL